MMLKTFLSKKNISHLKRECIAGLTTFLTMSYILAVNPLILGSTGMDKGAVFVATCLAAALGSFLMGALANYPIALAPSMSLNIYFAYIVVGQLAYSWQITLGAVFISGCLFAMMTFIGVRQWLIHFLPFSLKIGIMSGIGFFLALIGLKNLNLIGLHPHLFFDFSHFFQIEVLLALLGLFLIFILERYHVIGAIFISILIITGLGILFHLVSFSGIIAAPPSLKPIFLKLQFPDIFDLKLMFATLIFLFVALFDNTGTLIAVLSQAKLISENGKIKKLPQALFADSLANIVGALLGTSSTGSYIESATGVRAGGRTGLTAIVVSFFFLLSLGFAPLINMIPPYASTPALIYVAFLMSKNLKYLFTTELIELIPGLITAFAIPLSFSIATGVTLGFLSHAVLIVLTNRREKISWGIGFLTFLSFLYLILQFT
ncbi:MAG: hypothetical protein A3B69_00925 [Gammaproteobacteria bacterium RIFCSPHIGHO2_02_FULL_38_33]|nr:MAG: hypothetical protein A3B69_00925 [Gammaproteobacteria bacterium RIFCSPHIGHO2_02_FULL_38_33]